MFGYGAAHFGGEMTRYGFARLGGGLFMILFGILVIVGLVFLISRLFNRFGNKHPRNISTRETYRDNVVDRTKTPQEIAKERYAKGEIDKEKLNEILEELKR
ncbi:MAG: SHOCT domain-containing protein [Halanaerobiales bacterium]